MPVACDGKPDDVRRDAAADPVTAIPMVRAIAMTTRAMKDALRERCKEMRIDGKSFARKLGRCDLNACRGMCCYDGVYLDAATEAAIALIAEARRPAFSAMGLDLPEAVVVDGYVGGVRYGRKTATRPVPADEIYPDHPAHFNRTRCVFRFLDGRCGLQVLAVQDGVHPWTYKPTACWLFPIKIHDGRIALFDETNDPSRYEDYAGFIAYTGCGRTCSEGRPAVEVLEAELGHLGAILERDLIAEIRSCG
jgi:hypothetical protein